MEEIRMITRGDELRRIGARAFMGYINRFVEERAPILLDKEVTLEEEERWVEENAGELDAGNLIKAVLFEDGRVAGICEARRGRNKERNNASFGLSVSRELRGRGYGEKLLRKAIEGAKERFAPHRMWIEYQEGNEAAKKLYEKAGFAEAARLREYVNDYGQWKDKVIMEYRGK